MARPTTLRFGAGVLTIGDGAEPETFAKAAAFTSLELTFEKSTNDTTVPDIDNPDAVAWTEKDVVALGWSMSGSGVAAKEGLDLLDACTMSAEARNIRFEIAGAGTGAGTPNRRYFGAAHLKHSLSGQRGEKYQVKLDVDGSGELYKSNVAAV